MRNRILLTILVLLIPLFALAQTSATLEEAVMDVDVQPLSVANALLVYSSQVSASDTDCYFEFISIVACTYTLRITCIGYQAMETELTFGSGETVKQTFKLEPSAVKREEVTVTIGSRAAHTAADELAVP